MIGVRNTKRRDQPAVKEHTVISTEQVEAAELDAARAQQAKDEAQAALDAAPYSELAVEKLADASKAAAQKAAAARELREALDGQRAAARLAADRGVLESAAAAEIKRAAAELEVARGAIATAAGTAQRVLVDLMGAVFAYNDQVIKHSKVLAAAGLDLSTGKQIQNGTAERYAGPAVRIDGRDYDVADVGAVAVWVTARVGRAQLPSMHEVVRQLPFFPGCMGIEQRSAALFGELPELPKRHYRPAPQAHMADIRTPTKGSA